MPRGALLHRYFPSEKRRRLRDTCQGIMLAKLQSKRNRKKMAERNQSSKVRGNRKVSFASQNGQRLEIEFENTVTEGKLLRATIKHVVPMERSIVTIQELGMMAHRIRRNIVRLIRMLRHRKVRRRQQRVQDPRRRPLSGGLWRCRRQRRNRLRLQRQLRSKGLLRIRLQSSCHAGGGNLLLRRRWRRRTRVFRPFPLLLQFFVDETNPPTGFLAYLIENLKHFFLLATDRKTFTGDS